MGLSQNLGPVVMSRHGAWWGLCSIVEIKEEMDYNNTVYNVCVFVPYIRMRK